MAKETTRVVARYYPDGRIEEKEEQLTLKQLQEAVGGYIEFVPTVIRRRSFIVNEDGIWQNLPLNPTATKLVKPGLLMSGGLRGVALLVTSM